jgi:hypothetical protein
MFIPDLGSGFFLIPNPRVKKAPDPGSGSATLVPTYEGTRVLSSLLYIFVNFKIITNTVFPRCNPDM